MLAETSSHRSSKGCGKNIYPGWMDEGTRDATEEGAILICIRKQEGLMVRGGGRIFFRLEPALSVSALSQWTPLIEAPTHKDP